MYSARQKLIWMFAALALAFLSQSVRAGSLDVTYSYSGDPGDYTLNFTVHNDVPNSVVTLFGVLVDQSRVSQIPYGYDQFFDTFNTAKYSYGSSYPVAPTYNDVWNYYSSLPDSFHIPTGHSRSGFVVYTTIPELPTSVQWFAMTFNTSTNPNLVQPYTSDDPNKFYQSRDNKVIGFEGVIVTTPTVTPVPEPTTFAMTSLGCLAGLAYLYRRQVSFKA